MLKKLASLFIAALMVFGLCMYYQALDSIVIAQAINQSEVESRLNVLINELNGETATSDQMLSGIQCKGFANWVFNELFGVYIGAYPNTANYKTNITKIKGKPVATEVGVDRKSVV